MAILDRMWYVWDKKNTKPFMIPSTSSSQIYIQPSTLQSWSEYFEAFKDSSNRTITSGHDLMDSRDGVLADPRNINHASKASSTTATILSGLEHTIPDLATRSSLRIDIVGAAFDELIAQGLMEDILHYSPSLTKLTISYVGPHVLEEIQGIHERNLCTACTDNGRTFVTAFVQGLYHERRLTDMKGRNVTDLICAFNSGHTADDSFETRSASWAPTLKYILASNKPALFTTYTRPEAEQEEAVLDKMGANFILRPKINRWHGMVGRPLVVAPKGLMSYKNHYLYIIKGFKEGSQLAITQQDEPKILKQCIDKALAIDQSRD